MKKILFILFCIPLWEACDKGENQYDFYNNPVEGQWSAFSTEGQLLHTRVYTKQFYAYFSIINGESQKDIDSLHYSVYNNKLIFDRYEQTFSIISDTLWITNSKGDQTTKYIRKKNL